MIELWLRLKLWTEYIIPIATILLVVAVVLFCGAVSAFRWHRKIKLLKENGFERYLKDVASFGDGVFYWWKNETTGQKLDERDLRRWSYKFLQNIIWGGEYKK